VQPGDVIEFESTAFSTPEALGFVPQNLDAFSNELFVQALIHHGSVGVDRLVCCVDGVG
jgi:hypothetical protein